MPWHRLPERALLVFPVSGLGGMALLGAFTDGIAPAYVQLLYQAKAQGRNRTVAAPARDDVGEALAPA